MGDVRPALQGARRCSRGLRVLDSLLGPPILYLIAAVRRRRGRPSAVRSIVLLQTAALGDMALMSAALPALRAAFPQSRLIVAAGPDNAGLAQVLPHVDEVVTLKPQRVVSALVALRRLKPCVVLDFNPWPHVDAVLAALSGARHTIGYRTPGSRRHYAYDLAVPHGGDCHELRNQSRLVEALTGAPCGPPRLEVEQGRAALFSAGRYIVLHPWASGAGKRLKEWPAARWVELAARLTRHGYGLVLTGSKADQGDGEALAEVMRREAPFSRVIDLAGKTPVPSLLGLLDGAEAVVSVNTGVMHVAAALGRPTVGLCGPTNPLRWGPCGPHTRSVSPSGGRHSYLDLGHEFPRHAVSPMAHLSADAVMAALASVLQRPALALDTAPAEASVA